VREDREFFFTGMHFTHDSLNPQSIYARFLYALCLCVFVFDKLPKPCDPSFSWPCSVQAFTDLMNRALDKPAEQLRVNGAKGGPIIFNGKTDWAESH